MLVLYAILHCLTIFQGEAPSLRDVVVSVDAAIVEEAFDDVVEPIQVLKKRVRSMPLPDAVLADAPRLATPISWRADASHSDLSWWAKRRPLNFHQLAQPPPAGADDVTVRA